jgi:elongator complex protein 1
MGTVVVRSAQEGEMDAMSDISQKTGATKTSYTMSQTTGIKRKKEKKGRSFLNRNIKEGSPVEEEYLVEFLLNI